LGVRSEELAKKGLAGFVLQYAVDISISPTAQSKNKITTQALSLQ